MDEKLIELKKAVDNLDGVLIPYNIIKRQIQPLQNWLDEEFKNAKLL